MTKHHIIGKSNEGGDDIENILFNVCRNCHDEIERIKDWNRGQAGAGRDSGILREIQIGRTNMELVTGSVMVSDNNLALIPLTSPIYGVSLHNKFTGQENIKAFVSGANYQEGVQLAIVSSPSNSWVVYSIIK